MLLRCNSGTIKTMKDRDASRHPGPFRIMQVDSEIAGLLVAVGFLVMGFVSMPIATGFVLGAITLGGRSLGEWTSLAFPEFLRRSQAQCRMFSPLREHVDVNRSIPPRK